MTIAPAVVMTAPPALSAQPETARGRLRPAPVLLALVVLGLEAAALVLDVGNTAAQREMVGARPGSATGLVGLLLAFFAVPILQRLPGHAIGRVLATAAVVWTLDGLAESWMAHGAAVSPPRPLTGLAFWFVAQFGSTLLLALPLVLVLYPAGRLLPGRWRSVSLATIASASTLPVLLSAAPPSIVGTEQYPVPASTGIPELLPSDTHEVLLHVAQVLTLLSLPLAVAVVFARHRRADGLERTQLRWLVWAAVVCVLTAVIGIVDLTGIVASVALVVGLAVTGLSITIGLLKPDLTDVDALMGSTLVFAAVAAVVVGLDLALVAVLDTLVGERLDEGDQTLLVLVVAVAVYGPLRSWAGVLVRRTLVGRRGDRYDVVTELAARLEESPDVATQLPALTSAVARTFKLDAVQVEVLGRGGDATSATHGQLPAATQEVPITYGGEAVGRLVLPARGVRSMLSRRDQQLLFDVVRQAAMAVRSSRLAEELQRSREQLVLAREEDRRRIRRDLHDGLGPVLGGVAMRIDAAGNAMTTDVDRARDMLTRSRADLTEAMADVRRLVHGLRPPALDDLGLLDALRQQVERTRSPELEVDLDAEDLPQLPAAVEVAAYRIASEGLTNTVRHAGARRARLRLAGRPGGLLVELSDDGRGIDPAEPAGVGLRSIRERAEELGGHSEVSCPEGGGTRVSAWLPVAGGGAA